MEYRISKKIMKYQNPLTETVHVGNVKFGTKHPLIIQSMCNTNSLDTDATVNQCIRIIEAGGELVRISVQGEAEAKNLEHIKTKLVAKGYHTPLSADAPTLRRRF